MVVRPATRQLSSKERCWIVLGRPIRNLPGSCRKRNDSCQSSPLARYPALRPNFGRAGGVCRLAQAWGFPKTVSRGDSGAPHGTDLLLEDHTAGSYLQRVLGWGGRNLKSTLAGLMIATTG
jgi:hypothetical protein